MSGPVDAVKQRIVRVHAHFPTDAPTVCELPGVLRTKAQGRLLTLSVCDGAEPASTWARGAGASSVDVEHLSMEDLFIDYTTSASTGAVAGAAV